MRKESILLGLMITLLGCIQSIDAQLDDQSKAKAAIQAIWFTYHAKTDLAYLEPLDYIIDSTSKRIIGQILLDPSDASKYNQITLVWKGSSIPSARIGKSGVLLSWNGDQVEGVKLQEDYVLSYDNGVIDSVFTKNLSFNNYRYVNIPIYDDRRLIKMVHYANNAAKKEPWISFLTTFKYDSNSVVVSRISYTLNKPNISKNIQDSGKIIYTKIAPNSISVARIPHGPNRIYTYDANNNLISKKEIYRSTIENNTYKYLDNKKFSEERIVTNLNNEFIVRELYNYFTRTDLPESSPDYEKTEGKYKFDINGELYYEARGLNYREKKNGVWSDWQYFRM